MCTNKTYFFNFDASDPNIQSELFGIVGWMRQQKNLDIIAKSQYFVVILQE